MPTEWNFLSDELQLVLSVEALRYAAGTIAGQADLLAHQIEAGVLADRGGADALRLLAAVVRVSSDAAPGSIGQA